MKIHLAVTVLLEYVYLYTTCMKIKLGIYYSVHIMLNALPRYEILGISLQITHSFVKRMHVSNTCNTDFCLFIVLGDKFNNQYLALYLSRA